MATRRDEIADTLRRRVLTGLHFGTLQPGDRLPSVRVLEAELKADPRVILASYRRLEGEGLVELRPRSGIYVAPTSMVSGEMLPQTAEWVVDVLVQGLGRGIPAIELPERMRRCLETLRLRAACLECNRDQITGLCTELHQDYGLETHGTNIEALRDGDIPHEVRRADLLVTTSFHAAEVQPLAKQLGKPMIVVSLRADFREEVERILTQGPVYFVVADPRFAAKLPRIFSSASTVANLRPLVAGQDDLTQLPDSALVYVMQAARALLDELELPGRVMPAMRVFSVESARQLLTFIIKSNAAALLARDSAHA
jgi:DNA-binding transcriptional regulator YhcF (GntR family)